MNVASVDNILITDPKNMHYYSGFYNGEGYLFIGKDGLKVVTDSRYTEYAQSVCTGFEICDISKHKLSDFVAGGSSLGFEDKHVSYAQFMSISKQIDNLIPTGDMTLKPREVKDSCEIECISAAVSIGDRAFEYICDIIKAGMTEKEIAAELDCFMKKNGGEGNSFSTVVAAGERGSLPHAIPTDRQLKHGDLVVMDYGCTVGGYAGDMTRTVAVGDVSEECQKVYHTVLQAQQKALDMIKSGELASDIDGCAREIINREYNGRFGHALGHSVGLDIHESPNLSPKNKNALVCGNVVTVEPGIYIPGLCGVRIEDVVVITADGHKNLTHSPKELIKVG